MELKEKITLDMLTKDSVSEALRQQFLTFNGEEMQVGGKHPQCVYEQQIGQRTATKTVLSDEYYNAVMAVLGRQTQPLMSR